MIITQLNKTLTPRSPLESTAAHSVFISIGKTRTVMAAPFSYKEFKTTCIEVIAEVGAGLVPQRRMRFDDHVIRKLRNTMVLTGVLRTNFREALLVIVGQIADRTSRSRVRYADVELVIAGRATGSDGTHDEDAEWAATPVAGQALWGVRRILDRFRRNGATYYLVDWTPTEETRANIPINMIAAFERERRALVRRTYIEDQAEEAQ